MSIVIPLPYDKPPLTLNQRLHWRAKSKITKALRQVVADYAWMYVFDAPADRVYVELHYVPRDSRRRDADNLVATLKPCIDGLVDGGLVPDDTPQHVRWAAPIIHVADPKRPRLYLIIDFDKDPTP